LERKYRDLGYSINIYIKVLIRTKKVVSRDSSITQIRGPPIRGPNRLRNCCPKYWDFSVFARSLHSTFGV